MDNKNAVHNLAPELAEALLAEELRTLEGGLERQDPAVLRALRSWAASLDHLTAELAEVLPLRELLAHYALADVPAALTLDEADELAATLDTIEKALERHPGLQAEMERIRADRDAFELLWEEESTPEQGPPLRSMARTSDRPARRSMGRWAWRTAAAAGIVLFVVALSLVLRRDSGFTEIQAGGETERVELEEGSTVLLAEESTLQYRLNSIDRRVRLIKGEALFEVVQDDRPFVVETEEARVTVVGTTFGVNAEDGVTSVTIADGVVDLAARFEPAQSVRLEGGQQSRIVAGSPPEAPSSADVSEALSWTGVWYFRAEPLGKIATVIEAYHGIQIHVPGSLAAERVTGAFERDQAVSETLRTLASALGTTVRRDSDGSYRFVETGG